MPASDAPVRALGSSGMSTYGDSYGWGAIADANEHVPDVIFPSSIATYTRMRTDATIQSVLAAYVTALVAADWRIDPKGADPRAVAVCADSLGLPVAGEDGDDIGDSRRRGVKFIEHVRLACLHLTYGFLPFEPVYEVRPDGYAYLKALPERLPSTIVSVDVNNDGTLKSITQEGQYGKGDGRGVVIPAERLLWYVHEREGAIWTGRSLLRAAYAPWILKMDTLRVNAIGIARFGAGTPVAEPLPGTNPTPAQIAEAQRMVSSWRVGETGGAVPVGFKARIIGVEGTLPDALPTLAYLDMQIARSTNTSLLDLGNTATGSRALGDSFMEVLLRSLQSVGDSMAETASQLCVRLTEFNFGEGAVSPVISCGDVGASKAAIAQSITSLLAAGAVTPDASLESYVRDAYHLPPADSKPPVVAPVASVVEPAPEQVAASGWQPWVRAGGGADRNRGGAENLRHYYTRGPGAALIRWGTDNDHARCVALVSKHMTVEQAHGYCNLREKEVTGEYPAQHAKRLRGAEGDPYREPTPAEQAAGVDPAAADADQDGLVAEGMALLTAITDAWGAALAAQITTALAGGSLAALARLTVDSTDAAEGLAVLMREAADVGVRQVLAEAARAGVIAPEPGPVAVGERAPAPSLPVVYADSIDIDTAYLDDAADAAAELAGQGMARAAGKEAARLAAPGVDPAETAHAAVAAVSESDTPIHDTLHAEISRAIGAGRTAAQQAVQAQARVKLVPFATAQRDRNVCQPCADNDQHEYPDVEAAYTDFPTGHYAQCLGRSRCRCVLALKPVTA